MIELTVSLPPEKLSGNASASSLHKARAVQIYRIEGKVVAAIAYNSLDPEQQKNFPLKSALIIPTFFHDKKRKRDRDNLTRSLKAVVDGLCDGGLIEDDSEAIILPPEREIDKERPRVELKIVNAQGFDLIFKLKRKQENESDSQTKVSFEE